MAKEIISCELSFIPIQSPNYIAEVEKVLEIIKLSGLNYETNAFSTIITGEKENILNLIGKIIEFAHKTTKFIMAIKISNTCGCNL